MPIKISHFCVAPAHLSTILDFAAAACRGKQTVQCSWAPQDSKRGILILFFFLWQHSDLFGHKKRKSTPPSEKDWEVRTQIMPDPLTCRLGNTTGQEMNPQQVKVLDAQRSLINSDSDTLLG